MLTCKHIRCSPPSGADHHAAHIIICSKHIRCSRWWLLAPTLRPLLRCATMCDIAAAAIQDSTRPWRLQLCFERSLSAWCSRSWTAWCS